MLYSFGWVLVCYHELFCMERECVFEKLPLIHCIIECRGVGSVFGIITECSQEHTGLEVTTCLGPIPPANPEKSCDFSEK